MNESIVKTAWICCTVAVCVLIASIASYQAYQTHSIAAMVKNGASPLDVGCALNTIPTPAEVYCHK